MSMNYLFLDTNFEEIEAVTTIDLLRRANIALTTVSVTGSLHVMGAHQIEVKADCCIADCDFSDAGMLILPGGATHLDKCQPLCDLLLKHNEQGKQITGSPERSCYARYPDCRPILRGVQHNL